MDILSRRISATIRRLVVESGVPVLLNSDCSGFGHIELDCATGDRRQMSVCKPTELELSVDTGGHRVKEEDVGDGKYVSVWERDGGREDNDRRTNVEPDSCPGKVEGAS